MRLKSVQIESYKSLLKPASIELGPGFNVIVGQNNAGKTALVEAMSLTFGNHPTRTLETMPDRTPGVLTTSSVVATFDLSGAELKSWLGDQGDFFSLLVSERSTMSTYILALNEHLQQPSVIVRARYVAGGFEPATLVGMGTSHHGELHKFRIDRASGVVQIEPDQRASQDVLGSLTQHIRSCIYAFRAERVVPERRSVTPSPRLEPDASNLAAVLLKLQRNPTMFARYNRMVSLVLPQIKQVSADAIGSDIAEVLVWGLDPTNEREDLALPLSTCGTGVGQVLAILYIAVTESSPRTIIIDEPQSFLHPGAVRKLLDVLRGFPQHQYVITTHSPAVISAASPATLTIVRKTEAGTSEMEQLSGTTAALEDLLAELGANLSDVFGVEAVIWVEGATEERCLRIVVDEVIGRSLLGTAIIGVVATGDFEVGERRRGEAERTIQIYHRLSRSGSVVPAKAAFIFDREGRNDATREDIRRRAPTQVHFLDRRMYENYLLYLPISP